MSNNPNKGLEEQGIVSFLMKKQKSKILITLSIFIFSCAIAHNVDIERVVNSKIDLPHGYIVRTKIAVPNYFNDFRNW